MKYFYNQHCTPLWLHFLLTRKSCFHKILAKTMQNPLNCATFKLTPYSNWEVTDQAKPDSLPFKTARKCWWAVCQSSWITASWMVLFCFILTWASAPAANQEEKASYNGVNAHTLFRIHFATSTALQLNKTLYPLYSMATHDSNVSYWSPNGWWGASSGSGALPRGCPV